MPDTWVNYTVESIAMGSEPPMDILRQALVHMRSGRWDEAHVLVQRDESPLAAWLHGILHIQEGDLGNAEYWYGQAMRDFHGRGTIEQELERFEAELPQ
jgi:hypothetical protein